jgi:hypothetical protein
MVRTYWLVQVFNEASWNLDLQPDRTDDQVESNFGPVLCGSMVAAGAISAGSDPSARSPGRSRPFAQGLGPVKPRR